jgi:hypothetical protein
MNRTITRPIAWLGLAVLLAFAAPPPAVADFQDAVGDFIPSFTGPQNPDLDVVLADVVYDRDRQTFTLSATMNGDIGTTAGALYVFGFNRGQGTARFASIGIDGVLFDSVVVINQNSTGAVNDLVPSPSGTLTLGPADITISGVSLRAIVPLAALPSEGFDPEAYTWNLWPRSGQGGTSVISDFAPDNSNLAVRVVPEPASAVLLGLGFAALAGIRRVRTRRLA